MSLLSVVIPVYNAENTLWELFKRLQKSLESITSDYEIILVDDGSKDKSWEIIKIIAKSDHRLRATQLVRNFGQHVAITAGLHKCNGDHVVVMDCDLQDSPEEIARLYAKAGEGYHVVVARRNQRKDGRFKIFCSIAFYKVLSYLSGRQFDPQVGCFRIISRQVVDNYRLMQDKIRFFISMVEWMGFSTASVDILHAPRYEGKSNYTLRKLFSLAMDIIIANSYKPLKVSILFGISVAILSFIVALYLFVRAYFYGVLISGWSSIMISLFFIGGVMIFNLGLLGIYISKIFDQVKNRPLYIQLDEIGFAS